MKMNLVSNLRNFTVPQSRFDVLFLTLWPLPPHHPMLVHGVVAQYVARAVPYRLLVVLGVSFQRGTLAEVSTRYLQSFG